MPSVLHAFSGLPSRRAPLFSVAIFLFFAYAAAIALKSPLYSTIFSLALNIFIAATIAYCAYRTQNLCTYWGHLAAGIALWSASDIIWLAKESFGVSVNEELFFTQVIYFAPIAWLLIAALSMLRTSIGARLEAQNLVDASTIVLIYISFAYFVVFKRNLNALLEPKFTFNIVYIYIDVAIFCAIFCIYFSLTATKRHISFFLALFSLWLFSIYDAYYSVITMNGVNLTDTLFDLLYELPFLVLLLAGLNLKGNERRLRFKERRDFDAVLVYKFVILLVLIGAMILISAKFDLLWVCFVLVLLLFYGVMTHHVSSIKSSEFLMQKEKNMRERLNIFIEQRISELNATNKCLAELGQYDYLTRALNRPHFLLRLEEMIKSKPLGEAICVFSIDISHFKTINDSYGHHVGDDVLAQVVKNIKAVLPRDALVARFGGDDLTIAAKQSSNASYRDMLNRLIGAIKQPIFTGEHKISLSANIGVAQTPTSEIISSDLIAQADAALDLAKKRARADAVVFYDDIKNIVQERNYIEILLNSMEFDSEFRLNFQPQYQIEGKKLVGAEALLRWHSPIKGFISPSIFIPIAEQSPLIIDIGKWVAKRAIAQMSQWNATYGTSLKIGINVSPKQIDSVRFAEEIISVAKAQNIDLKCVDIEITEVSWMAAEEIMQGVLREFSTSGVSVSIDDFGTGFSSLSYIKKYSINKLKIAKELIDNIAKSQTDKNIVMAIITLAKRLGVRTIAEGVEEEAQLEILRELGCDEVQGYLWGKPMSAVDFEELIRAQR